MSTLSISLIELLAKGIPEGFLFTWAIFIFSKTPIDKKKYLLISTLTILTTFIIRRLPINYGVNTMLSLLIMIILFVVICKVDIPKVIISVIGVTIILFISEELNILLLRAIYGTERTIELLTSTMGKSLYGIPSTIFFAIILLVAHRIIKKRNTTKIDEKKEDHKKRSTDKNA